MLDFNAMSAVPMERFRDGEGTLYLKRVALEGMSILHGCLPVGSSIGWHRHETNAEVIYILSGCAAVIHEEVREELGAGMCHVCEKGEGHSLINIGEEDLEFFAVIPDRP